MKPSLALTALLMIFSSAAFARTIMVYGNGSETGHCTDTQGYFCISTLKDRAESTGKRQAEWSCQSNLGTPLIYTAYCSTFCSPNYIPPGQSAWVRCDANCSMQCDVR
jgi:hypothetical protein